MQLSDFDYVLPEQCIAQTPLEPRDASRLLVLNRATGALEHRHFYEVGAYLQPGDVLVFNDSRVIPARLWARKIPTGGKVELLLLARRAAQTWEVLVGGAGVRVGTRLALEGAADLVAEITEVLEGARRRVHFSAPLTPQLDRVGHVPLPPYIHTPLADPERYQTVYARQPGSAAAPTAGLHFTPDLLARLRAQGVQLAYVTLHIGLDTFAPVTETNVAEHVIHTEWCELPAETARQINEAKRAGRRVVAVGTTAVRVLETAGQAAGAGAPLVEHGGPTQLFILPGYSFQVVDALITNFHLPRSTLLMLVAALAGRERILAAYAEAQRAGYRFFSFGDAMLIE